jgi:protein-L-isoaspartate O-methyltransferase
MLAIDPGDRLLEIGGGPGVTASLVCELLEGGSLLLIDRSATAIERTLRRNRQHIASGRLALQTVDLADYDVRKPRFDTVFAVNVRSEPARRLQESSTRGDGAGLAKAASQAASEAPHFDRPVSRR